MIEALIEENEKLKQRVRDVEVLLIHLMDNKPQNNIQYTKMDSIIDSISYGYEIIKSNMTLIVFLNGVTLFGYGLAEMFL